MTMSRKWGWLVAILALLPLMLGAASSLAVEPSVPANWAMGMIDAASPVKDRIHDFHDLLLWIITIIVVFVLVLLLVVIFRFNAKANPTPSKTTHHTMLEIVWTLAPVLILVAIAAPSFRLLYFLDRAPNAEMTIKVTGHQWYWSYEYPDNGNFTFDSYMLDDKAAAEQKMPRLLGVDNRLVVPVDTQVRVLVTSADVMHSWLVPPFGVQIYAFPGRTNETWLQAKKEGIFFGQCNQICGINHGFMPIAVEVVSKEKFAAWAKEAQTKFAANQPGAPGNAVAQAVAQ
jgi:cytochrome c oxidase subunit 2